jgi:hypothetical protein
MAGASFKGTGRPLNFREAAFDKQMPIGFDPNGAGLSHTILPLNVIHL